MRIYDYQCFIRYLKDAGLCRPGVPAASAASFARRLGYRSQRSVTMVLDGSRLPSADMVQRLSRHLGHDERERCYFSLLVERARQARRGESPAKIDRELELLRPTVAAGEPLDEAAFAAISAWYALPIKQLIEGPGFREDPAWIRRRLRRKVTEAQVTAALAGMERLGLIQRDHAGQLMVTASTVAAGGQGASAAVQRFHRQMLDRASEALTEQRVDAREFGAVTLAFDPARLAEAKAYFQDFYTGFAKRFHSDAASEVFQLTMQFFAHTRHPGEASAEI